MPSVTNFFITSSVGVLCIPGNAALSLKNGLLVRSSDILDNAAKLDLAVHSLQTTSVSTCWTNAAALALQTATSKSFTRISRYSYVLVLVNKYSLQSNFLLDFGSLLIFISAQPNHGAFIHSLVFLTLGAHQGDTRW